MHIERASRTPGHKKRKEDTFSQKEPLSLSLSTADAICQVLSLIPLSHHVMQPALWIFLFPS